jgi:hypothetical protein
MTGRARHRERGSGRRLTITLSVLGIAALLGTGALGLVLLNGAGPGSSLAAPAGARPVAHVEPVSPAAPAAGAATVFPGFWSGTDSTGITIPGPAPYREPGIGGAYGGYIGMAGNWATWQHCGTKVVWSGADSGAADIDYNHHHEGIGTGVYWFMGGPGVDPHYNGTTREASAWGAAQAARTLADIRNERTPVTYPVVFMDIEIPGHAPSFTPAEDNGWNTVYTSACSGRVKTRHIAASVDRAEFNGYASYLTAHSKDKVGVYSEAGIWASIFGTGSAASIPNTYEWTYAGDTSSLSRHPAGWCLSGTKTCAQFFGGVTAASKYAVMWQWTGGGGTFNGIGDLDQIDGSRTP